jgi:hypothetical protein
MINLGSIDIAPKSFIPNASRHFAIQFHTETKSGPGLNGRTTYCMTVATNDNRDYIKNP